MPIEQSQDAPRPNHSTGPKTPEGKARCRLNAYRHGLTGRVTIVSPEERQAYDTHSEIVLEGLAPATNFERLLAQNIAERGFNSSTNDLWRLERARSIEASSVALGMQQHAVDNTGDPEVDDCFAQARTWAVQAANLNLLTVYAQRIQRAVDKNMAQLKAIQAERKLAARETMEQAKLVYQLTQAQGKPYRPETLFAAVPDLRESVFSAPEVARELNLTKLLKDAETYNYSRRLPEEEAA